MTPDFAKDCIMHNLRSAAREVTRRYEDHLRPHDLTGGQFSTLAALSQKSGLSLGRLAEALGMDRTTLTRNLGPLRKRGLVDEVGDEKDARIRRLVLTKEGHRRLEQAMPSWTAAQEESRTRLAGQDWTMLREAIRSL